MNAQSSPLSLVPMEAPAPESAPTTEAPVTIDIAPLERTAPKPPQPGAEAKVDRFAREASRQFSDGHLDQPLWDRAFAQAKGDQREATDIYLRARATALRLLDREQRIAQHARNTQPVVAPAVADELVDEDEDEFTPPSERSDASRQRVERRRAFARYRIAAFAAAGLAVVGLVIWGAMALLQSDETPVTAVVAKPATPVPAAPKAAVPVAAEAGAKVATGAGTATSVTPDFKQKIQELNDAGNWNLLVLYSVEWTRREPANADAWNQLRDAYVKMRQYDDALGAAAKAVELAPANALYRRHFGQSYVDVDDQGNAIKAFEEAVARDPQDIESLRQIATMHMMLGQPQDAKAAFDRALAVSAGDPTTLCLRNGFAQMPPPTRDARATMKLVKAIDAKCHGLGGPESVPAK